METPKIKKFAVIEVDLDYDHLNGLEHIQSFLTREEAENFVKSIKDEEQAINLKFINYIDDYVEKIEVPKWENHVSWMNFTKDYPYCNDKTPDSFKSQLRYVLRSGHQCKKSDFSPPPRSGYRQLEIVEMKE